MGPLQGVKIVELVLRLVEQADALIEATGPE